MNKTVLTSHSKIIATLLLSASIHAASLYGYLLFAPTSSNFVVPHQTNLNINFSIHPTNTVKAPDNRQVAEPPLPENPGLTEQTQIIPVKSVAPNPEIQKTPKPAPYNISADKVKKPVSRPDKIQQIASQSAQPPAQASKPVSKPLILVEDSVEIRKIEDQFIVSLLDEIEKNKFYPNKARRRNIQGTVEIKLSLDKTGKITSIQLSEGHKILRQAAEKAILAAAPFSVPPSNLAAPQTINFGVQYKLR